MGTNDAFVALPVGDATIRLMVALILGAVVGLERELHGRPAGVRTHGLVCLGSALFTMLSVGLGQGPADPGRVAAGIVTGIGFLGAGTIMRHGSFVQGLTTAASIWVAAAIGMACGLAWYPVAIIAAAVSFFTLAVVRPIAHRLRPSGRAVAMQVRFQGDVVGLPGLVEHLHSLGAIVHNLDFHPGVRGQTDRVALSFSLPPHITLEQILSAVRGVQGVLDVEAEEIE
ncbi:MAG: MgtC/SapB family protein [Armatimonadetes bacterium]|nr:MgtC/SapB family protein [Armatimonadota bacterium]